MDTAFHLSLSSLRALILNSADCIVKQRPESFLRQQSCNSRYAHLENVVNNMP